MNANMYLTLRTPNLSDTLHLTVAGPGGYVNLTQPFVTHMPSRSLTYYFRPPKNPKGAGYHDFYISAIDDIHYDISIVQ